MFRKFYYEDDYLNKCINNKNMTDVTRKIFVEDLLALGFMVGSIIGNTSSYLKPNICNDEDAEVLIHSFGELKKIWNKEKECTSCQNCISNLVKISKVCDDELCKLVRDAILVYLFNQATKEVCNCEKD